MRSALLVVLGLAARAVVGVAVEGITAGPACSRHGPDEYLWSKLPGRCCFDVKEICPFEKAPRSTCKHVPPTHAHCGTWSTPENYCPEPREL